MAVDGLAEFWYSEEGPGQAAAPPSPLLVLAVPNKQPTHQRPMYQLHIIRSGTTITFAL